VLDHIALVCPDVKARAEVVGSYSSLTFQRYTLTKGGSAYGIKKTARRFLEGWFNPATRVRNLFLTGQSIGFNGIHGSIVSSVNLCGLLMGNAYITGKIAGVE
jgi:phytoene dehydrogenase-like protein